MRQQAPILWLIALAATACASAHGAPAGAPTPPGAAPAAGAPTDPQSLKLAEGFLKQEITRRLGNARSYDVRIDPEGTDLAHGQVGRIHLTAEDVRTPDGLVIARVEARTEPMRLGPNMRPVDGAPPTVFTAYFDPMDLTRFARRNAGGRVSDLQVELARGKVVVRGKPEVLGLKVDTEVAGRPVLRRHWQIHFHASRVSVLGVRITELAADYLEKQVNPLIDLSDLKLPVRFKDLQVRRRYLTLEGSLDLVGL